MTKRLWSTILTDLRLQLRNGFYYAALFVVLIWIVLLNQLPDDVAAWLLPVLIVENILINAYYFMGGLVLLEKGEGTLEALVVTPLRHGEYLASKVITLTLLSIVESVLIVLLTIGLDFRVLPLLLGIGLASPFLALVGFVVVSRYDSLNEYLFPSFLYTAILSLPLLPYFGLLPGPWVYAHPLQAPLVLLQAAFQPVPTWQLAYGVLYGLVWLGVAFQLARRGFYRFVILKPGAR